MYKKKYKIVKLERTKEVIKANLEEVKNENEDLWKTIKLWKAYIKYEIKQAILRKAIEEHIVEIAVKVLKEEAKKECIRKYIE